jgi:hypothetical protein
MAASEVVGGVSEVGRTGAPTAAVEDNSGQMSRPQARSVGQQPPPRDAGHERNPEEQTNVLGALDVLIMVVIVAVVLVEVDGAAVVDVGGGGGTTAVGVDGTVEVCLVDDCTVEAGEGVTTTVAVELSRQPPFTQAYPGIQQPPPG